eukprot:TRINITY_DN24916_c0_g1_i2.p1 TRINITY_DN24916_c0_g1~~TRINITY_DN24916_c0_g1_i2.p1  ORF type:complete len:432 (-),score=63.03 TRINITY_DN24916_c0_g1_i2:287-1582(-)
MGDSLKIASGDAVHPCVESDCLHERFAYLDGYYHSLATGCDPNIVADHFEMRTDDVRLTICRNGPVGSTSHVDSRTASPAEMFSICGNGDSRILHGHVNATISQDCAMSWCNGFTSHRERRWHKKVQPAQTAIAFVPPSHPSHHISLNSQALKRRRVSIDDLQEQMLRLSLCKKLDNAPNETGKAEMPDFVAQVADVKTLSMQKFGDDLDADREEGIDDDGICRVKTLGSSAPSKFVQQDVHVVARAKICTLSSSQHRMLHSQYLERLYRRAAAPLLPELQPLAITAAEQKAAVASEITRSAKTRASPGKPRRVLRLLTKPPCTNTPYVINVVKPDGTVCSHATRAYTHQKRCWDDDSDAKLPTVGWTAKVVSAVRKNKTSADQIIWLSACDDLRMTAQDDDPPSLSDVLMIGCNKPALKSELTQVLGKDR